MKHDDDPHCWLLRPRRDRPSSCSTAEQRDELAPLHSITSSVRASSDTGISRPSAAAVLRLMTNSNLVANWHRKLSGHFAPENTIYVGRGAPVKGGDIHTVRGQAAARYMVTVRIHGGQVVLRRERSDQFAMDDGYWISVVRPGRRSACWQMCRWHRRFRQRFARERRLGCTANAGARLSISGNWPRFVGSFGS